MISIIISIGGLILFFVGLNRLRNFILFQHYDKVNNLFKKTLKNNLRVFLVGIFSTFLVQSSSSIISIAICLVSCNVLNFTQAIIVILGSNIGTCFSSFVYALNYFQYSFVLIIIGIIIYIINSKHLYYHYFIDLGMLFYGLYLTENGLKVILDNPKVTEFLFTQASPILSFFCSTFLSGAIQSSSIVIILTQNLFYNSSISFTSAIAIILGANVGTCFTGLIASISNNKLSKKVALFNILFNLLWSLGFMIFLDSYAKLIYLFNPVINYNKKMMVSIAHLLFNIISSLVTYFFVIIYSKYKKQHLALK